METLSRFIGLTVVSVVTALHLNSTAFAQSTVSPISLRNAEHVAAATNVPVLGVARGGSRIVTVGDHGVVLLSDDDGKSYRQARVVPTNLTLAATYFVGSRKGWAVGHGGVIIATEDGGETWQLERSDMSVDQPLFSVYFRDEKEGWAVGLWSLMLHTTDGGRHWSQLAVPVPLGGKKADKNLYSIFSNGNGTLLMTSEQGLVLRSTDDGATWDYVKTGYSGSLWTGIGLRDGTLLVGGLRGSVLRSEDNGKTWSTVRSDLASSITAFGEQSDGSVVAVGVDGAVLKSTDGGRSFNGKTLSGREALTAVLPQAGAAAHLFSDGGPLDIVR
ncbi:WD40/YVTN/BNR-like repeat-containing protein [Paraburkholderia sp.]|uniref:WD40/YVTN/BNR-like repeat-containing protein n=1 Tax=Paraburkholderia sp. TaxID=1926495 RepID=UPI003C7BC54B